MDRYAHIVGWGKAVPSLVLTNDELAKRVDTSDKWIREMTGIRERRIASDRETTLTLSLKAVQNALQVADADPESIDLIICCTASPEFIFPATACLIQDGIGATHSGGFDLGAGCSGFAYGLSVATAMIRSGQADNIIVVGAETLSRLVDWKDRATCVLFGDGAGAFLLRASERRGGIMSTVLGSDGSGGELLMVPGGGSRHPTSVETITSNMHTIKMNGREVYRFATRVMAQAARQVVEKAHIAFEDIDLLIPHQANVRIIDSAAKALKLPPEKVFVNLDRYGNTSAASIPIATVEAIEAGRINPDDHIVFVGFGAGLTWGAVTIQWTEPTTRRAHPIRREARGRLRRSWASVKSLGNRVLRRVDAGVSGVIDKVEGHNGSM